MRFEGRAILPDVLSSKEHQTGWPYQARAGEEGEGRNMII